MLDLNNLVSTKSPVFSYLFTYVYSPEDVKVLTKVGSDDGVRVWVNGALAWSHEIHRPVTPDEDRFDVSLKKGWNRMLVKVKNDYGGYRFCLRFADVTGIVRCSTKPQ